MTLSAAARVALLITAIALGRPALAADPPARVLSPSLLANINTTAVVEPYRAMPQALWPAGPQAYFSNGALWRTDGFTTHRVGDGVDGLGPSGAVAAENGGRVLFETADRSTGDLSLWITDGTTRGTARLAGLPRTGTSAAACGGRFCFSLGNNLVAVTDGTPETTQVIARTEPEDIATNLPLDFRPAGDRAFFVGYSVAHGQCVCFDDGCYCGELWSTDGTTAGTRMLRDIVPGPAPAAPLDLFTWRGKAFFTGFAAGNYLFRYVYASDGTESGTVRLFPEPLGDRPYRLRFVGAGPYVYFLAGDGQMWRTDGTAAGTRRLSDIFGWTDAPLFGTIAGSEEFIVFTIFRGSKTEFWSYDGRSAVKLLDAHPNAAAVAGYSHQSGRVLFNATRAGESLAKIWATDGTVEGTAVLEAGAHIAEYIENDRFSFFTQDVDHAPTDPIWRSDGTSRGTALLGTERRGDQGSVPQVLASDGRFLYFLAYPIRWSLHLYATDGTTTRELMPCGQCDNAVVRNGVFYFEKAGEAWTSDGTPAGTMPLAHKLGSSEALYDPPYTVNGATLYFIAASGSILMRRAGNETTRLATLGHFAREVVTTSDRLFFTVLDQLWVSDGTTDGTKTVATVNGLVGAPLRSTDRRVFFVIDRTQLWTSDGSAAGTVKVADLPDRFEPLLSFRDLLLFRSGGKVWRSDGTSAGTSPLLDVAVDLAIVAGNRVALIARTQNGADVWLTDGTTAGTSKRWTTPRAILDPFSTATHTLLPYARPTGEYSLLDLTDGAIYDMPIGGTGQFAGVGDRVFFRSILPSVGEELVTAKLSGESAAAMPVVDVRYVATTQVANGLAAVFEISMIGDPAATGSVSYATVDAATTNPREYEPISGTLEFGPDAIKRWIVVPVTRPDPGTFAVVLSAPQRMVIGRGFAMAAPAASRRRAARH